MEKIGVRGRRCGGAAQQGESSCQQPMLDALAVVELASVGRTQG